MHLVRRQRASRRANPSERAASGAGGQCSPSASPDATASTFTYDANGNELTSTARYGCMVNQRINRVRCKAYNGVGVTSSLQEIYGTFTDTRDQTTCMTGYGMWSSYQYDAGGHTTNITTTVNQYPVPQQTLCPTNGPQETASSVNYTWDPIGHPILDTQTGYTQGPETLHYDGDTLLFSSNTSGIDDIKLGLFGEDVISGIGASVAAGVYPTARDINSGTTVGGPPFSAGGACNTGAATCEGRTDGFSDC